MKNEIMQRLAAVISAMNSISVMGKMNMAQSGWQYFRNGRNRRNAGWCGTHP